MRQKNKAGKGLSAFKIGSIFIMLFISVGSILYAIIQKTEAEKLRQFASREREHAVEEKQKSEAAKIFAEQILKKTSDSLIILHARIREMEDSLKKVKKGK